jgi:hypothetical protein
MDIQSQIFYGIFYGIKIPSSLTPVSLRLELGLVGGRGFYKHKTIN